MGLQKTGTRDHLFSVTFARTILCKGGPSEHLGNHFHDHCGVTWKPQTSNTTAHLMRCLHKCELELLLGRAEQF
jgi:hypothetical protein